MTGAPDEPTPTPGSTDAGAGRPDQGAAPPRDVVWLAGSGPHGAGRHVVRRWLALLAVVGAVAFLAAYAVHLWWAGTPAPSGPAAPLWLPDGAPDAGCPAGGGA